MKRYVIFFALMFMAVAGFAQQSDIEMADNFRSEGKIFVVVAVIMTILIGLFIYLIRLDRKLTQLENDKK